jgi:hypothetical protein
MTLERKWLFMKRNRMDFLSNCEENGGHILYPHNRTLPGAAQDLGDIIYFIEESRENDHLFYFRTDRYFLSAPDSRMNL